MIGWMKKKKKSFISSIIYRPPPLNNGRPSVFPCLPIWKLFFFFFFVGLVPSSQFGWTVFVYQVLRSCFYIISNFFFSFPIAAFLAASFSRYLFRVKKEWNMIYRIFVKEYHVFSIRKTHVWVKISFLVFLFPNHFSPFSTLGFAEEKIQKCSNRMTDVPYSNHLANRCFYLQLSKKYEHINEPHWYRRQISNFVENATGNDVTCKFECSKYTYTSNYMSVVRLPRDEAENNVSNQRYIL